MTEQLLRICRLFIRILCLRVSIENNISLTRNNANFCTKYITSNLFAIKVTFYRIFLGSTIYFIELNLFRIAHMKPKSAICFRSFHVT